MISLSELDNISKATEQQEQQQSTLGQKVAETVSAQQEQQYAEDMQSLLDAVQQMREREQIRNRLRTFAAGGGIHIDPSKRGTFTAAASRHGMGVQEFASRVLAHKENYSPAMVKKANFARNASHWHADGGPINILAKGGLRRFDNAAQMIEHFEGFRASPYRDGKAYSVGYGQYMYGDGANLDWKALLSGKKKLTREEGHQQVLRSIDKLKGTLRRTLGDELYNSLTPGQLMGYLDTGYQRPASMINAAKVHRQRGAAAAASVLGVNGFADRNAARRAAFTGNWGSDTGGFDYQYTPTRYNSNSSLGPIMSSTEGGSFAPISVSPTQREFNPWWGAAPDEDFMAQQYTAASGVGTGSMEPQWFALEYNQPKSDAPDWFADGGYLYPIYII